MEILKKTIYTEQFFISDGNDIEISTVLGSCVAVCLYDPISHIIGMNHYLLPFWNGRGLKSLKYGNINNRRLIEAMLKVSKNKNRIQAKIFGGASINLQGIDIGLNNIMVAKSVLGEYNIKIVGEDTGGYVGRKIIMNSSDGAVYLKYAADRRANKNDRRVKDRRQG